MALKPEVSIGVGLATVAVAYGTYAHFMPAVTDARVADPNDPVLAASERSATWTAAAIVAGISLIAKDPTVFVMGGATVLILAWTHRHANMVDPATGKAVAAGVAPVAGMTGDTYAAS